MDMTRQQHKHDWLMMLIVIPCAILGAVVLWFGARDVERIQQKQMEYNVDSARQQHRQLRQLRELKTAEDTLHEFEDGY